MAWFFRLASRYGEIKFRKTVPGPRYFAMVTSDRSSSCAPPFVHCETPAAERGAHEGKLRDGGQRLFTISFASFVDPFHHGNAISVSVDGCVGLIDDWDG